MPHVDTAAQLWAKLFLILPNLGRAVLLYTESHVVWFYFIHCCLTFIPTLFHMKQVIIVSLFFLDYIASFRVASHPPLVFWDRVSLCNSPSFPGTSSCRPGWPQTHRDLPASASWVLGLKMCATTTQLKLLLIDRCIIFSQLSIWLWCAWADFYCSHPAWNL